MRISIQLLKHSNNGSINFAWCLLITSKLILLMLVFNSIQVFGTKRFIGSFINSIIGVSNNQKNLLSSMQAEISRTSLNIPSSRGSFKKRPSRRQQREKKRSRFAALKKEAESQWETVVHGTITEGEEKECSEDHNMTKVPRSTVSSADLKHISFQLGYTPTNLVDIAARKNDGTPAVLLLHPLAKAASKRDNVKDPQPFPTIYWLSCPDLKSRVSKLEKSGSIDQLQKRLEGNPDFLESMEKSHQAYERERWDMLNMNEQETITRKGWLRAFEGVGIGGMRNFKAIKCLHMHYAHFLATKDNMIGSWVNDILISIDKDSGQPDANGDIEPI